MGTTKLTGTQLDTQVDTTGHILTQEDNRPQMDKSGRGWMQVNTIGQ